MIIKYRRRASQKLKYLLSVSGITTNTKQISLKLQSKQNGQHQQGRVRLLLQQSHQPAQQRQGSSRSLQTRKIHDHRRYGAGN